MKVYAYRVRLDEARYPVLVKEEGKSYICDGRKSLNSVTEVFDFCCEKLNLQDAAEEYVYALPLDVKNRIMGVVEVSHGISSSSIVRPRELFQRLLLMGAEHFILLHNHPSGCPEPSSYDFDVTSQMIKAGALIGVDLTDHVIVALDGYYSFRETSEIWRE